MLIELAIGDAYGAGFEYVADRIVRTQNNLSTYLKHPRHDIGGGRYTDDTQMTLAIVEAMLSDEAWTPTHLARRFVEVFKRDPRAGYAGRFYAFLQEIKSGDELLARIINDSDKSGAAMRACPMGYYPTIAQVMEYCQIQAAITHNTTNGILAAQAAALAAHFCIYRLGSLTQLPEFLSDLLGYDWQQPWHGKVGAAGLDSVHAAITALSQHHDLAGLLQACIAYTGDVDTVATIALGAGSMHADMEHNLPQHLLDGLENGVYGRDYLQALDQQLMDRFVLRCETPVPESKCH